jgi:hypothetical protein
MLEWLGWSGLIGVAVAWWQIEKVSNPTAKKKAPPTKRGIRGSVLNPS